MGSRLEMHINSLCIQKAPQCAVSPKMCFPCMSNAETCSHLLLHHIAQSLWGRPVNIVWGFPNILVTLVPDGAVSLSLRKEAVDYVVACHCFASLVALQRQNLQELKTLQPILCGTLLFLWCNKACFHVTYLIIFLPHEDWMTHFLFVIYIILLLYIKKRKRKNSGYKDYIGLEP